MNDSIGLYLNDIGKVSLLNAEEERELSRVIEAGRAAADRLANAADRLIDRLGHLSQLAVPRRRQVRGQVATRQRLHPLHAAMNGDRDAAADHHHQQQRHGQSHGGEI